MKIEKFEVKDFTSYMLEQNVHDLEYKYSYALANKILGQRGIAIDWSLFVGAFESSRFCSTVKTLKDFIEFFNTDEENLEEIFFSYYSHRRTDKSKKTIEMYKINNV